MKLKIKEKEYNIKFGFKAVAKGKLLKKLAEMETVTEGEDTIDKIGSVMELLPELLLAGMQANHSDEFSCDFDNADDKAKCLDEMYDLLDSYFEGEDADFMVLFDELQKELLDNGFLAKMFREEVQKAEQTKKVVKKSK